MCFLIEEEGRVISSHLKACETGNYIFPPKYKLWPHVLLKVWKVAWLLNPVSHATFLILYIVSLATVVRFSKFFFCLKDTEKWWWTTVFFFQFFWFFKAVGPKWVFQSFLWLDRKYSPIFTFDMSLQRYWTADFRIFEKFWKWAF